MELEAKGVDVIDLGAGDADLPPPPAVVEAVCRAARAPARAASRRRSIVTSGSAVDASSTKRSAALWARSSRPRLSATRARSMWAGRKAGSSWIARSSKLAARSGSSVSGSRWAFSFLPPIEE